MNDERLQNGALNDIEAQNQYWRENYRNRPYSQDAYNLTPDLDYDRDFSKAYELGHQARSEAPENSRFEDMESGLQTRWEEFKAESRLKWEQAKHAVKDAWDRM